MTERELAERCRGGERKAQQELYTGTSERIYGLLLKMTSNPDDAFDLTQDTYLKAFARIAQFDGRSSLATWLYRIAVNEALQFLRRARKERDRRDDAAGPAEAAADADRTAVKLDVAAALAAVSPEDRAVLLLRYQHGLDYRAIAEVLDCAEGTVASRLNRARNRVRPILHCGYSTKEETVAFTHPTSGSAVQTDVRGDGNANGSS